MVRKSQFDIEQRGINSLLLAQSLNKLADVHVLSFETGMYWNKNNEISCTTNLFNQWIIRDNVSKLTNRWVRIVSTFAHLLKRSLSTKSIPLYVSRGWILAKTNAFKEIGLHSKMDAKFAVLVILVACVYTVSSKSANPVLGE